MAQNAFLRSTVLVAGSIIFSAQWGVADQLLTSPTAFQSALPGPANTVTFDSATVGTMIASGTSLGGITFTYDSDLPIFAVVDSFDTTSGANSLGDNDPGNYNQFVAGDGFQMSFAATEAIGLYFITSADPVYAGDIELMADGSTALNSATPYETLGDTGTVYFIGLIANTPFTTASISFNPNADGAFFFNVDDITTAGGSATPEPSSLALGGAACLGLAFVSRRRRK